MVLIIYKVHRRRIRLNQGDATAFDSAARYDAHSDADIDDHADCCAAAEIFARRHGEAGACGAASFCAIYGKSPPWRRHATTLADAAIE